MPDFFYSEVTPQPLNRVAVKDGLLLTAQHWDIAHQYHRQKQNLLYQSFHTQGIVSGLGVSVIQPPRDIPSNYRDFRWLKVDTGVAVDGMGNIIIVPQPMEFRIASSVQDNPFIVYLVISYIDPEDLRTNGDKEIVTETFRLQEKVNPPEGGEIELCRMVLPAKSDYLTKDYIMNAEDVFHPDTYAVDLRYRPLAGVKPLKSVRIGQIISDSSFSERVSGNFTSLSRSLSGLYPQMSSSLPIMSIDLKEDYGAENNDLLLKIQQENIALIYLNYQQINNLSALEIERLKLWSQSGSTIMVECRTDDHNQLNELKTVQCQLISILQDLVKTPTLAQDRDNYQEELNLINNLLEQETKQVIDNCAVLADKLTIYITEKGEIDRHHSLGNYPFLFGSLPIIDNQLIDIFNWQNFILIIGNLTDGWSLTKNSFRQRQEIRTAQEMGINLLHFAYQYHYLRTLSKNKI